MGEQQHTLGQRARSKWLRRCAAVLFACVSFGLTGTSVTAFAASTSLQIHPAVGYNGYYDDNHLVQVAVSITNPGKAENALLRVTTDNPSLPGNKVVDGALTFPVHLNSGTTRKVIAIPGSFVGHAVLSCVVGNVIEKSVPVTGNMLGQVALVAVVSGSSQAAQFLTGASAGTGGRPLMPERIGTADLPNDANLMDGLTAIAISPNTFRALSAAQRSALNTWVTLGGVLLVTGTSNAHQFGSISLPLVSRPQVQRDTAPLVQFAGDAAQPPTKKLTLSGAVADKQAVILAGTEKSPYIAASIRGRGIILQTAFSPMSTITWQGNNALWTKLIGTGLSHAHPVFPQLSGSRGVYTLTNAGNALSPLRVPSLKFWGSIFLLYVLAIGPVLFYFLRTTKREPWGWIALPVVSLVTTAAIYGFGASQRPNGLLAEGVGVLELNGNGQAIAYGVTGFTSPFITHAVAAAGDVQFVMPMASDNEKHQDEVTANMGSTASVSFRGIPRWGVRFVYSAGTVKHQGSIQTMLQDTDGTLTGSVTNKTPYAIHDAGLIWNGNVYELKTLNPGDTVWIDGQTSMLGFKGAWLPTYSRYNGDLTHGLGRVLGSYLAEQPVDALSQSQAVLVGTNDADRPPGANTPSTVDIQTKQKTVSRQDVVLLRQLVSVNTVNTLTQPDLGLNDVQGVAP